MYVRHRSPGWDVWDDVSLTIPQSRGRTVESDKRCSSSGTLVRLRPPPEEETSPAVCQSLNNTNTNTHTQQVWEKKHNNRLSPSPPSLTSQDDFPPQVRPLTDFGDERPDAGGAARVPLVCPCRWDLAGEEGQHIRVMGDIQQEAHVLSIFSLRLFSSTQTLVDDVRLLHPHPHRRPEPPREGRTVCGELQVRELRHRPASHSQPGAMCLHLEGALPGTFILYAQRRKEVGD